MDTNNKFICQTLHARQSMTDVNIEVLTSSGGCASLKDICMWNIRRILGNNLIFKPNVCLMLNIDKSLTCLEYRFIVFEVSEYENINGQLFHTWVVKRYIKIPNKYERNLILDPYTSNVIFSQDVIFRIRFPHKKKPQMERYLGNLT